MLLLLSGDVELNPGPTIDDRPNISLLTQWLEPLVDWQSFGYCLPGITQHDVSIIEAENFSLNDQKRKLYTKWLSVYPEAKWSDVITALTIRRENTLAQNIREMIEGCLSECNVSDTAAVGTTVQQVMFETKEGEEEVSHTLEELNESFTDLFTEVRIAFDEKVASDPKLLLKLRRWIETYMHWNDILTNASLDEIFKIIHPYYDFIDCNLIVVLSQKFLSDVNFGVKNLNIVRELQNHKEKANTFRSSSNVSHLHQSLIQLYQEHVPDLTRMPHIIIKLNNPWCANNIGNLTLLIQHLLPVKFVQSLLKYMTIIPGSVVVKFRVLDSTADSLIKYTRGKLQFMRLIGIFSLYINDHPVLHEDENMNFTFELALLEAVTAGNNEAVEFLLQLKTVNINHTNEEGKTALTLASEKGHKDIMDILLSAGASYNIKENKDVPDVSELNIGPMIDDRPDISLLIQWLEPIVDWKRFGLGLPGITYSDVSKIEAENAKIDERKLALYSKWLKTAPKATWADIISALNKIKENKLVQDINRNLRKCAPRSARSYAVTTSKGTLSTRLPSRTEVMFQDENEILRTLTDLNAKFTILMMYVQFGFQEKIEKDPKMLHVLIKWLETYMHWNDKLTDASLDETFKIIYPFYDFIDCSLIVDMSEEFLQDFKFGHDELNIVNELINYQEKANKLRFSAQVKHLHESLKTIYEGHIPDTSNMPMIVMKLHNLWHGSNINGLSILIHKLLPVGHQQSIMKYITISSGCILIKYSVYGSTADSLIEYSGRKLQFMRLIGIFILYINDHPVLQEDENINFTFEVALFEAVTAGNNEAVEFLLQLETVNIDHTNEEGKTALMLACKRGHEDTVHSLLSAGANVNIQDNEGWTALMRASKHNHISIIHMLLQANANPHLKKSNGSNSVMIASFYGNYEVVELMISKGVDYKYQREDGVNAFMLACENGHTQIVEFLLKEQVDPNVQNKDGGNAFMLSYENGHTQIVELLLKEQVDPHVQNGKGVTALMISNAAEQYEVVIADPTTRCNEGNSLAETAKLNLVEA